MCVCVYLYVCVCVCVWLDWSSLGERRLSQRESQVITLFVLAESSDSPLTEREYCAFSSWCSQRSNDSWMESRPYFTSISSTCVLTFRWTQSNPARGVPWQPKSSITHVELSFMCLFSICYINCRSFLTPSEFCPSALVILVEPLVSNCSITPCFLDSTSITLISVSQSVSNLSSETVKQSLSWLFASAGWCKKLLRSPASFTKKYVETFL